MHKTALKTLIFKAVLLFLLRGCFASILGFLLLKLVTNLTLRIFVCNEGYLNC